MLLFNQYVVTGGMPEVVQAFAETRDFASLGDVYETLLQGYRDDSEKYVRGGKVSEVVRFILNEGWSKAGQIITLGNFGSLKNSTFTPSTSTLSLAEAATLTLQNVPAPTVNDCSTSSLSAFL